MIGKPKDVPADVWVLACDRFYSQKLYEPNTEIKMIARAILDERARWKPAAVYFERYCQDEADSVENCVCGQEQHDDAKAFRAAIRGAQSHD